VLKLTAFASHVPDFYGAQVASVGGASAATDWRGGCMLAREDGAGARGHQQRYEAVMGEALEGGRRQDAIVAKSTRRSDRVVDVRDSQVNGQTYDALATVGFDVSVSTVRFSS